jgi:hypothetical protein
MGRWSENDQRDLAILKLTGAELHEEGATWQCLSTHLGNVQKRP